MGRGNIRAQFKQYRDALAAFDRSIELDPGSAHIWMGRAEVLAPLNRYDEAIAACDRALRLNPNLGYAASTR